MRYISTFGNFINEGNWASMMKGVRSSESGPWSIIAIENKKVVGQKIDIRTKEIIPAHYEGMKKEYPKAKLHIEDKGGQVVWNESFTSNESDLSEANNSRYDIYKTPIKWEVHPTSNGSYIAKVEKSTLEIISRGYGNWMLKVNGKLVMPTEDAKEKTAKDNHTSYGNWGNDMVGALKHTAQEMFESIVNEGIYVNPSKYIRAHGKNPTGSGVWAFEIAGKEEMTPKAMSYTDAKKWAEDMAKEKKVDTVYVLG